MNPETQLVKKIKKYLHKTFRPSLWIKIHGGRFQVKGLPDIIGCYKGRFFGLEVKLPGEEDSLSDYQEYWISLINLSGGFATMVTTVDQAIDFVRASVKNS